MFWRTVIASTTHHSIANTFGTLYALQPYGMASVGFRLQ